MATIPTDPLFALQLHLQNNNAGQLDLNIVDVWDDYTGQGVQVTVNDNGFDLAHNDLDGNYLTNIDYDYTTGDTDPRPADPNPLRPEDHGTAVMGIVGAEQGNSYGGVGVAWNVDLVGYRGFTSGMLDAAGLGDGIGNVNGDDNGSDIITGSYGVSINFSNNTNLSTFEAITEHGRGGLGTVFTKSNGNNREGFTTPNPGNENTQATTEAEDSMEYSISVAALRFDGWLATSSTPGANLLVSAFAETVQNVAGIVSTDRTGTPGYNDNTSANGGDFTFGNDTQGNPSEFNGTSAAAPQVAGVVALMLEANPDLGWRDVQTILAYSARQVGSAVDSAANTGSPANVNFEIANQSNGSTWFWNDATNWNGGGLHYSNDYGYGLVDALAAVRLAETWHLQSTTDNQVEHVRNITIAPLNVDNSVIGFDVDLQQDIIVEYVTLNVDFSADDINDIQIFLESPDGTRVELLNAVDGPSGTRSYTTPAAGWDFGTNAFRGTIIEGASDPANNGDWKIRFGNIDGAANGTFQVTDVDIIFTGREIGTSSGVDTEAWIFTNEYSDYDGVAGHIANFNGGAAGASFGTINAAAVSSNTTLDFVANTGTIDGVSMQATNISHAYTGDGNDVVTGDGITDLIFTGRGNDTINGGTGSETLNGGRGNDSITGGSGNDIILDGAANVSDTFGTDTIDAGAGNDLVVVNFVSGGSYQGGSGTDTVDTSDDGTGVDIDLSGATFTSFGATFGGFENGITGSGGNTLIGSSGANTLIAGRGNDSIDGGGGNDTLFGDDKPFGMLAMNQDGVTDQFAQATTFDEMPENNFTVEWLFRGETAGASGVSFVSYGVTNSTNEFLVFGNTGGNIVIFANSGASTDTGIATSSVLDGDVHRMSVSVNTGAGADGRISLYIDGVEEFRGDGASTNVGSAIASGGTFIIGQDQDGNTPGGGFQASQAAMGEFGDIRVWSTERDAADIAATAFEQFDVVDLMDQPALVANWQLNQSSLNFSNLAGSQGLSKGSAGSNPFTASNFTPNGGNDSIQGGAGNDTIEGGSGNDTLDGGTGSDDVFGQDGDDTIHLVNGGIFNDESADGGAGVDTLVVSNSFNFNSTWNMDTGSWSFAPSGGGLTNFENFDGTDTTGNWTILDTAGANTIETGSGNDTLNGGAGADSLNGGGGTDTLSFAGATARVALNETSGSDGDATGDTYANFERYVLTDHNDFFFGTNVTVEAGAGNDVVQHQGGTDSTNAGDGVDTIVLSASAAQINSTFDGGNDFDTLRIFGGGTQDLRDDTLISLERLTYQGSTTSSISVQMNATQTAQFNTISTFNSHVGQTLTLELFMDTETALDLSGMGVTAFSQIGDGITINGDADDETITGSSINDTILGNDGNDTLNGGAGFDDIEGGAGNDLILLGDGDEIDDVDGGTGIDTFDASAEATRNLRLDLADGTHEYDGDGNEENLLNIENVIGGGGDDTITGTGAANTLIAGAGDDTVEGGAGADSLNGGAGTDTLTFENATAGVNLNETAGSAGDATGDSYAGFERYILSDHNDFMFGTNVTVNAGGGNDTVQVQGGTDSISGDAGDDTLTIFAPAAQINSTFDGGTGTDALRLFGTGTVADMRDDTLTSLEVLEVFTNTSGSVGVHMNATQLGQFTTFTAINGHVGQNINVEIDMGTETALDLSALTVTGFTEDGDGITVNGDGDIELIIGSGVNDTLLGGGDDDVIIGGGGRDVIEGGSGSDDVTGSAGADTFYHDNDGAFTDGIAGEGQIDTLILGTLGGPVSSHDWIIDLTAGTGESGASDVVISSIENVIGGSGGDFVLGDSQSNNLRGLSGNDDLSGEDGDDIIDGGNGDDTVNGGDGVDIVRGGGGVDRMTGGAGMDDLSGGIGDDIMSGGTDNDVIIGQGGADNIGGDEGNDTINGGSGNDSLDGGSGDDVINGQGNNDTLLGEDGNDTLRGAAGLDSISGGDGDDNINGGAGVDRMDGGAGNDTMTGTKDTLRDTFVFAVGYDNDVVNSYEQGTDKVEIDDALWGGGLTRQEVIDTFGTANGTSTRITLDFGGGDILELANADGFNIFTLGSDLDIF